jgi:hypothetical protein
MTFHKKLEKGGHQTMVEAFYEAVKEEADSPNPKRQKPSRKNASKISNHSG